jgi:hypothetical protein
LRYAKFYLRSTYQTAENGDDADKGKLEYYALLDRIERTDFHYFTEITGLTLTRDEKDLWYEASHDPWAQNYAPDTDPNPNQSVGFGVLKMAVHDNSGRVGGEVKVSTPRVSTFDIQPISEPLYRRFNKATEDLSDDPDTLMFYRARTDNGAGSKNYLYEDQHSIYSYDYAGVGTSAYGNGISFLGQINNKQDLDNEGKDKVYPHNFAIYVDTAYVNRGTGWIKPQYLLVVDPKTDFGYNGCPTCAPGADTVKYVYGRYLRNQADSAWVNGAPNGRVLKDTYIWKTQWNRLSFVNAIHALDTLYILNEQTTVDPVTGDVFDPIKQYYSNYQAGVGLQKTEVIDDPNNRVNFKKLYSDGIASGKVKAVPLNNNKHKDEVFSFRFVERQIDSDGNEIKDASKEFLIESESTTRTTRPVIAPMEGGWIKIQDYVPVITRGAYRDVILQAEVFNVEKSEKAPVANETVAAATEDVKVISGKGSVTILNGAGKQVLISNLLGQTVVRAVLTSDQVTLDAPQGVVVVTIDGNAVKAVVK